jgi:deoxyadenosine/deoxycytidine kinase
MVIEGNIGAGKTTLAKMIAEDLNGRLVLEEFSDNPFLPYFYNNPERYAFPVELFFMTERYKQLQEELTQGNLFQHLTISDYFFLKTLLFASHNLKDEENRLFHRLFDILNAGFPHPDLLLYLHRPVEELLSNIKKRGRSYEQDIKGSYLKQVQTGYFVYFKSTSDFPIVILDLQGHDFVKNPDNYQLIKKVFDHSFVNGINRISLNEL